MLTPSFAARLFAIHARLSAKQNIILAGETVFKALNGIMLYFKQCI